MKFPGYHISMLYKLRKTQAAYNNQGFGFHVTSDTKPFVPTMRYYFNRYGHRLGTTRNGRDVTNPPPAKVTKMAKAMTAMLAEYRRHGMHH